MKFIAIRNQSEPSDWSNRALRLVLQHDAVDFLSGSYDATVLARERVLFAEVNDPGCSLIDQNGDRGFLGRVELDEDDLEWLHEKTGELLRELKLARAQELADDQEDEA